MQKRDHCSFRHKASWMDFNTFKLMHLHFILSAIWFYFMYECRHPAISMFNRIPRIAACLLQADLHRKFPTSQWQIQGIFHIRKLCVNVRRFETLGWLWRPQDSVQVISASPSFRRFLQRPKKNFTHRSHGVFGLNGPFETQTFGIRTTFSSLSCSWPQETRWDKVQGYVSSTPAWGASSGFWSSQGWSFQKKLQC